MEPKKESLSKWHQPTLYQPALHHGEKSKLSTMYLSNLENMQNYDLLDVMDPSSIICVNPYEVNPIVDELSALTADVPPPQMDLSPPFAKYTSKSTAGGIAAAPYQTSNKKIKVEMEEFGDLSTFVPTSLQNTGDELNTPVFNKDQFDFSLYDNGQYHQQQQSVGLDACVNNKKTNLFKDTSFVNRNNNTTNNTHRPTNDISRFIIDSYNNLGKTKVTNTIEDNIPSPEDLLSYQDLDLSTECEVFTQNSLSNNNSNVTSPMSDYMEDSIVLNTNQTSDQYFVQSPSEGNLGLVTPEDSNTSIVSENPMSKLKSKMHLNVNLNLIPTQQAFSLNTPDVIDEVVDLESADFNILDLVNGEDMKILNADEELLITQPYNSSNPTPSPNFYPSIKTEKAFSFDCNHPTQNKVVPLQPLKTEKKATISEPPKPANSLRRSRKRKASSDDDDDEYLPPSERKSLPGKSRKLEKPKLESDSESDSEYETKYKPRPRGRPPKRTESFSSDCSKDSDVSKYRELRDKNNEASRRSRFKRKIRELEYEKEADDLERRNVKLKAQVEELEKMVGNFRTNLFKIMINK